MPFTISVWDVTTGRVRRVSRARVGAARTCGSCGRTWDDAIVTGVTPAPSARCPFEYRHSDGQRDAKRRALTATEMERL